MYVQRENQRNNIFRFLTRKDLVRKKPTVKDWSYRFMVEYLSMRKAFSQYLLQRGKKEKNPG